jgi:ferritin
MQWMIKQKIENALNDQIHHEFTNAYSYLGFAAWFASQNLPGFAHWMDVQHTEELAHAMKLFGFVLDRGGKVELETLTKPKIDFRSARDVFAAAMTIEEDTTARVNRLYTLAVEERDYATQSHLQWYVDEQVEEEKNISAILAMLDMAGDSKGTLLHLDHQVAKRGK